MTAIAREYARGFFMQLHVIHALILRETRTRFGKHSLGYVWAFMEPLTGVGIFLIMFLFTGRIPPSGTDAVGFLCTGFLPYGLFNGTMGKARSAVGSNLALLYYPQVHTLDLVTSRCILETATIAITFFGAMLLNTIATQHLPLDSALKTLAGLGFAALLGSGFGLVLNSLCLVVPTAEHFIGPLLRPMFWVSGLFFSVHELPSSTRDYFLLNPVLHIVELTRDGWFETYDHQYYSYAYIIYWILGLTFVGMVSEKMTRKYLMSA